MNPLIQFKTTTPRVTNSVIQSILRRVWFLMPLVLAGFGLSPAARAVCQEGCPFDSNTVLGEDALISNTTGANNTANGYKALYSNTTGYANTAGGTVALYDNNGNDNTASGYAALYYNTNGTNNTATGVYALYSNTTGTYNTADGVNALYSNTTGYWNVAIGANAGKNLTTGSGNVCIGVNVLGVAGENNITRIRNVYTSIASGRAVYVNADNKIGTLSSSRRYKEEIKPMDKASEVIHALKPVTFRYKKDIDPAQTFSFGLIAEDVAKVDSHLITRDVEGKPETVRYEAVNAMLLNEFLKEHRRVEQQEATITQMKSTGAKQEATIAELKSEMEALAATVKEQASQIQKVSAQLEVSKAAPQTVASNTP